MGKPTTTDIVSWAEAHSESKPLAPNAGAEHLEPIEIVDILRWDAQGLTQEQIAAKCSPPRSQSTISRCLKKYGTDTTTEARRIFAAGAAPAAIKILAEGLPRDLIAVQKGLKVLAEDGSDIKIAIGISLPGMPTVSVRETDALTLSPTVERAND